MNSMARLVIRQFHLLIAMIGLTIGLLVTPSVAQADTSLAGIIEQMMPTAFATVPGLQWVAMSPSTDQSTIAMIAQWKSREDFESLGKNAGFDETNYWQTYADNEHDLFDVVKIIS